MANKIYDVFTFFNELDLLEIRLNMLYDKVDCFVIIECAETFSGLPKPLYFQDNKDRFKKFQDKILHYVVENVPSSATELRQRLNNPTISDLDKNIIEQTLTSDNIPTGTVHWLKEFYQKESIRKALLKLDDNDICFISDVDEIWNPAVTIDFTKDDIFKLEQTVYTYYLNNRSSEGWAGTLVTKYKNIKDSCLNHLRTATKTPYTYIANGGWHFTNQGGADKVIAKLEAEYSQDDYNTAQIKALVNQRIQKNQDYIGRKFSFWIDETDLPTYILEHKTHYQHLFKPAQARHSTPEQSVIVKLSGGLGNQLFQYAFGRAVALRSQAKLKLDLTCYKQMSAHEVPRNYSLAYFNIVAEIANPAEIYRLKVEDRHGLWHTLQRRFQPTKTTHIKEKSYNFDPASAATFAPVYLDGYWQTAKYFQSIEAQIRQELTLKSEFQLDNTMVAAMKHSQSVSIHIRRGDYTTNATTQLWHSSLPLEYYQRAVAYVQQHVAQPHWFVFSDDIAWVKGNLSLPSTTTFVSDGILKDYTELMLMSHCRHHIIANSSFSWWGAWLNPSEQKIVIAPKKWFNNPAFQTTDLLPDNWVQI